MNARPYGDDLSGFLTWCLVSVKSIWKVCIADKSELRQAGFPQALDVQSTPETRSWSPLLHCPCSIPGMEYLPEHSI